MRLRGLLQIADPDCSVRWVHFARYWLGPNLAIRPESRWLRSNNGNTVAPGIVIGSYSVLMADIQTHRRWLTSQPLAKLTTREIYAGLVSGISMGSQHKLGGGLGLENS